MTKTVFHARWLPAFASTVLAAALAACGSDSAEPPASSASSAPQAVAVAQADALGVQWNTGPALAVTANDTAQNGTATLAVISAPAHGTAVVEGQTIRYTPAAGYFGTDTLRYRLTVGDKTAEADVQLTVSATLTFSGTVRDNPMPGASVVATVGSSTLPAVTADADGGYKLVVQTAEPAAFISLQATGAGNQSHVVLTSLLGDAREAAAASTAGAVDATALPATNVTHVSTAIAVLARRVLGRAPASSADVKAAQGQFTSAQVVEMAAAIKLVADSGVALPSGVADTLALVSQPDAYKSFVVTQTAQNAAVFEATLQAVLGDAAVAVKPATPVAGGADKTLLLVQGEGASASAATRLVLQAGGVARVECDAVRSATWVSNGTEIAVTYDAPAITDGYSTDNDPVTGEQNVVETRETGFVLRQLGGTSGSGPATVKAASTFTYLDGSRKGKTGIGAGTWDTQTLVSQPLPFTAADFAADTRWAGVISTDFAPATSSALNQDVLRVLDGGKVVFERSRQAGTYKLESGVLALTIGDAVYTYARLFTGPRGEERWLAEKRLNGQLVWIYEPAVAKVQANAAFTVAGLTNRWESYINAGVSAGQFLVDLAADGSGRGISVEPDGTELPGSAGVWSVGSDGQMSLKRFSCDRMAAGCTPWHQRNWQLLSTAGDRIVVMERLTIEPSYDQYRVNVYAATVKK